MLERRTLSNGVNDPAFVGRSEFSGLVGVVVLAGLAGLSDLSDF